MSVNTAEYFTIYIMAVKGSANFMQVLQVKAKTLSLLTFVSLFAPNPLLQHGSHGLSLTFFLF